MAENCPIDLKYLTKQRITKLSNGQVIRDKWTVADHTVHQTSGLRLDGLHPLQDPHLLETTSLQGLL